MADTLRSGKELMLPAAPVLVRAPALWLVALVAASVIGSRMYDTILQQAAAAKASADASAAARKTDSLSLARRVEEGGALSGGDLVALDEALRVAPFVVPNDAIHSRTTTALLDSSVKLLRVATPTESTVADAQQLLARVIEPLSPVQAQRLARLRSDAARILARHALAGPNGHGKTVPH